jgi:hypothetical protein
VQRSYPCGPFTPDDSEVKLALGDGMPLEVSKNNRRGNRTKAVIPVKVKGQDSNGKAFEELVVTLDVTPDGIRLGSVHHELNLQEELTVFYRQRKIQFRVIWTKKMKGTSEFHVGLQAMAQDAEAFGLNFADYKRQPISQPAVPQTSGIA